VAAAAAEGAQTPWSSTTVAARGVKKNKNINNKKKYKNTK
jgi:hypothetical protein